MVITTWNVSGRFLILACIAGLTLADDRELLRGKHRSLTYYGRYGGYGQNGGYQYSGSSRYYGGSYGGSSLYYGGNGQRCACDTSTSLDNYKYCMAGRGRRYRERCGLPELNEGKCPCPSTDDVEKYKECIKESASGLEAHESLHFLGSCRLPVTVPEECGCDSAQNIGEHMECVKKKTDAMDDADERMKCLRECGLPRVLMEDCKCEDTLDEKNYIYCLRLEKAKLGDEGEEYAKKCSLPGLIGDECPCDATEPSGTFNMCVKNSAKWLLKEEKDALEARCHQTPKMAEMADGCPCEPSSQEEFMHCMMETFVSMNAGEEEKNRFYKLCLPDVISASCPCLDSDGEDAYLKCLSKELDDAKFDETERDELLQCGIEDAIPKAVMEPQVRSGVDEKPQPPPGSVTKKLLHIKSQCAREKKKATKQVLAYQQLKEMEIPTYLSSEEVQAAERERYESFQSEELEKAKKMEACDTSAVKMALAQTFEEATASPEVLDFRKKVDKLCEGKNVIMENTGGLGCVFCAEAKKTCSLVCQQPRAYPCSCLKSDQSLEKCCSTKGNECCDGCNPSAECGVMECTTDCDSLTVCPHE